MRGKAIKFEKLIYAISPFFLSFPFFRERGIENMCVCVCVLDQYFYASH